MKKKDFLNIKTKSIEELKKLVAEEMAKAQNTRLKVSASQEKNLKVLKNLRVEIAQIFTVIKEKEIVERLKK